MAMQSSKQNKRYTHNGPGSHSHAHHYPQPTYHNHNHSSSRTAHANRNGNHHNLRPNFSFAHPSIFITPIVIMLCILNTIGLITTLTLLYLTIRPFSIPTYRRLAANIGAAALLDALAFILPNMKIYLSGDSDMPNPIGCSILVSNHCMEGDWWAMLMLGRCVGLRGSVKAFLQRGGVDSHTNTNTNTQSTSHDNNHQMPSSTSTSSSPSSSLPDGSNHSQNHNIVVSASTPTLSNDSNTLKMNPSLSRNLSHHSIGANPNPSQSQNNAGVNGNSPTHTNGVHTSYTHEIPSPNPNKNSNNKQANVSPPSIGPMSMARHLLHHLLEFPVLSSENNKNYIQDRNSLFTLLRSFAGEGAPAPVHLLLFPEPTPPTREDEDCRSMLAKSLEFAKREGRPLLKHLLLPRTTGFYASLDSLRESSPVVYDVTMAYRGYHGEIPFSFDVSLITLWRVVTGQIPNEVHVRIKRYSMEEVLQDAQWLDKKWAEKDRLLTHFSRHQSFPSGNNRGFCRQRPFDTKTYSVEGSITALLRLGLIPFTIPIILLLSIPLLWVVAWLWIALQTFQILFPGGLSSLVGVDVHDGRRGGSHSEVGDDANGGRSRDGGTDSAAGTPFFPTTPFASPTHVASWRSGPAPVSGNTDSDSPVRR